MNAIPHREREHSRYSASAAERWMNCPGSVRLCDDAPERKSVYADEGTQAHELLEAMLLDRQVGAPGALAMVRKECSQDMVDAVQTAFDYVCDILDATPGYGLTLEKRFTLPSRAAPGEVFGTADITIYDPVTRKLWVIDYKHGSGVPVDVIGSKQLRFYGLGAMDSTPRRPIDKVELVIIQPRAFHPAGPIRSEEIDATELVDFYAEIEEAIQYARSAMIAYEEGQEIRLWLTAYLNPGEKTCRWCSAAPTCPARERQALALVGETFADIKHVTAEAMPAADGLTPERIGQILAFKDIVEDWLDRVEKRGVEMARQGVFIPGRKLVEPVGRRTYNDPPAVAASVSFITHERPEEFVETSPLGVTAMEKKIKDVMKPQGKDAVRAALDAFALLTTKKSSGNLTLVAEDDPRPAVNAAQAAFDGVVNIAQVQIGDIS